MSIIFVILFIDAVILTSGQDCQNNFRYVRGFYGDVEGIITLQPIKVAQHNLKVVLTIAAQLPTSYVGELSLLKSTQDSINDLRSGFPLNYKVKFPISNPLPKLYQIFHNGNQICTGQRDYAQYVSTVTLTLRFWTNLSSDQFYDNDHVDSFMPHQPQAPQTQHVRTTTTHYVQPTTRFYTTPPTTSTTRYVQPITRFQKITTLDSKINHQSTQPQFSPNHQVQSTFQCEVLKAPTPVFSGLVINGFKAQRTDFPWLTALYHQKSGFMCGGSLVSHHIVVTAGHCIHNKNEERQISEHDITCYMGKYDLYNLKEEGYVSSDVQKFNIHSNWDPQSARYDSDIAIAVLVKYIKFTFTIKPICIWTQSTGHHDLVQRKGTIAGWGLNEAGVVSNFPKYIVVPVVSDVDCLRSHASFSDISSNRTFCAGDKSGRSPCQGDSGGAFVVRHGNNFYLRGIVSAALLNENLECSRDDYTLFTDVSYYTNWINQHINQHG